MRCDIAVLSYTLGELPQEKQLSAVLMLWESAETLIIVEPGTAAGFQRMLAVRALLLEAGANIAAPCPSGVICPEADGWCHFAARVARSRTHRQAKDAELPYEDEKFTYLVATKLECTPCASRVLRHPKILKGHVELALCTGEGRKAVTISKRMGEAYHLARDLQWGDAAPPFPGQAEKESR